MEKLEQFFTALNRITKSIDFAPAEFAKSELDELRGKQRQAFLKLAEEIKASLHEIGVLSSCVHDKACCR